MAADRDPTAVSILGTGRGAAGKGTGPKGSTPCEEGIWIVQVRRCCCFERSWETGTFPSAPVPKGERPPRRRSPDGRPLPSTVEVSRSSSPHETEEEEHRPRTTPDIALESNLLVLSSQAIDESIAARRSETKAT